ncbi:MAG: hypothetical protein ABW098_15395 [Candidatus Thiodiazotropha sp.]
MFGFMEKNLVKGLLGSHLSSFGLALSDLESSVSKKIMQELHRQVVAVSKKYHEPVQIVSENICHSAAWCIAYCLLGPNKLLDVFPEFKDRTEEAEMELLLLQSDVIEDNNIYQQIYIILLDSPHCHPEVMSLHKQSRLATATPIKPVLGKHSMSLH